MADISQDMIFAEQCAGTASRLLDAVDRDNGFAILCDELARIAPFQNFIVYVFELGAAPVLFQTNLGLPRLQKSMALYIDGLYQLDPYHRLTVSRSRGLFRMRDIMPEAFPDSEYFNLFYRFTSVLDELRYVVPLEPNRSIHIFVEREGKAEPFAESDIARFRAIAPLIETFGLKHVGWHESSMQPRGLAPTAFDLRAKICAMPPGGLTNRETDTVELMLKGHSTKSLARELGIDDGTAANHKRNIYAKLDVHSQAQLFDLFLRTLAATGDEQG